MGKHLQAEHGIVCRIPDTKFGYFGWPTVARMDDGTLVTVSSGMRVGHVDPWGRTTIQFSYDDGKTWSEVRIINDSPIDDRDGGVTSLGGKRLLVSWFTSNTKALEPDPPLDMKQTIDTWTDDMLDKFLGAYVMLSEDSGWSWGLPIRVPISTPHGPILLKNGNLLYFGKEMYGAFCQYDIGEVSAYQSSDGGHTWVKLGDVPALPGVPTKYFCEPHAVELPSGKLIGAIRLEMPEDIGEVRNFTIMMTESEDGGVTWAPGKPLGFHGSPPHLLRHSSGKLVMSYGYRQEPFGERVAISCDDGATWEHDWILRDDGPEGDLGYPSTVELSDGSLYSVYYQKVAAGEQCSLLYSHWTLPE